MCGYSREKTISLPVHREHVHDLPPLSRGIRARCCLVVPAVRPFRMCVHPTPCTWFRAGVAACTAGQHMYKAGEILILLAANCNIPSNPIPSRRSHSASTPKARPSSPPHHYSQPAPCRGIDHLKGNGGKWRPCSSRHSAGARRPWTLELHGTRCFECIVSCIHSSGTRCIEMLVATPATVPFALLSSSSVGTAPRTFRSRSTLGGIMAAAVSGGRCGGLR